MCPEYTQADTGSPSAPLTVSRRSATSQVCPVKHMPTTHTQTSQHTLLLLYEASRYCLPIRGPSRETDASVNHLPPPRPLSRLQANCVFDSAVEGCWCPCGSMRQGVSRFHIMCDTDERLGLRAGSCVPSLTASQESSPIPSRHPRPLTTTSSSRSQKASPLRAPRRLGVPVMVSSCGSLLMSLALCLLLAGGTESSEFPDRECCDSLPPPPPNYHQATSTTTTTTPMPNAGHNTSIISVSHGASGIINCIEARQQCHNDPGCRDVLIMLHKICGPELVACATVTPGKCKLLLRTLGTFDYLTSCSCAEPHIDFSCYTFRETIFNHPCSLADTPEDDIAMMPSCNDAKEMCTSRASCLKNYMEFVNVCSFSGITCTAQDSEKCNESWRKMRLSPVFGCTCAPPPQVRALAYGGGGTDRTFGSMRGVSVEKEDCMWIYNKTHENPCLAGQNDLAKAGQVETAQTMCHVALDECQKDEGCRPLLDGVMLWCEHAHCEPDRCRTALQEFYQRVSVLRRLQVAFCVCRQSDPDGECLTAMRKLHPTCAERHAGRDPMRCHKIADHCRKSSVCRKKLQEYEQKCAADAVTGRCSDTHRSCQQAVMNILGTELHATCVCKGTDFLHQHDCYTWQKLLWSNPCVIESHLKLHEEINSGASEELDEMFRQMTPAHTTPDPRPPYIQPTPEDSDFRRRANGYGSIRYRPQEPDLGPRPSETYAIDRNNKWEGGRLPGISTDRKTSGGIGIPFDRNGEVHVPPRTIGGHNMNINLGGSNGIRYPTEDTHDILEKGGLGTHNLGPPISPGVDGVPHGRERFGGGVGVGRTRMGSGINIGRGRNGGGGITIGRDRNRGAVTIGRDHGGGIRVGVDRHEPDGDLWNRNRATGLGVSPDRSGVDIYNPDQNGNNYRNRPRGEIGHGGTSIGETDEGVVLGREKWRGTGHGVGRVGRPGKWPLGKELYPVPPEEERETRTRAPGYLPEGQLPYVTPPVFVAVTSTPPPMPAGGAYPTTVITTPTVPRRTCSMKIGDMTTLRIPEGSTKRHYKDSDCSELCQCHSADEDREPQASCITLACMDNKSCNTTQAHYPHTAPYYLAYRGNCVCYGGNFICQKPDPEEYSLGPGIYLFLGYSRGEVKILQPHTSTNEHEAVKFLEAILIRDYGFKCTLETKHHLGENFIILAELTINPDTYIGSYAKQRKEKEECAGPLQKLADKINARPRHPDIITDSILSMFILAEVDVNIPEAQTSLSAAPVSVRLDLLAFLSMLIGLLLFSYCGSVTLTTAAT
ncbi:uncharacterized protein [Cherax quadricarinatus]|uniref:uncharacterized protein isoform X4 n=1 Tax=Cherax quadricarinatus TaxID=27406 RepID=UPI00387E69C4